MTMQDISALTTDMERLAGAGEWERVRELAQQRDALLQDYTGPDREDLVARVLRSNQSILEKTLAEREAAAASLAELRRGRRSVSLYLEHREL